MCYNLAQNKFTFVEITYYKSFKKRKLWQISIVSIVLQNIQVYHL